MTAPPRRRPADHRPRWRGKTMAGQHWRIQSWTPTLPLHRPASTRGLGGRRWPTAPRDIPPNCAPFDASAHIWPSAAPASSASPHFTTSAAVPALPFREVSVTTHSESMTGHKRPSLRRMRRHPRDDSPACPPTLTASPRPSHTLPGGPHMRATRGSGGRRVDPAGRPVPPSQPPKPLWPSTCPPLV